MQAVDLALILVDADHVMPEIGKTRPRYEPDIARTHHRNFHDQLPLRETLDWAPRSDPRGWSVLPLACSKRTLQVLIFVIFKP
jgi:hypothetical protein